MSQGLILLDIVGLTPGLVNAEDAPALAAMADGGTLRPLECPFPALTLSSQASLLTGKTPREHGIVGNGWYWPELGEVLLWRQPHRLLQAEDLPTRLRRERPGFQVAKLFWWFNMYAPVDWAMTPRPMYPADGRKVPDIHTHPSTLRDEMQERFGRFPLFRFWGPMSDFVCSEWITDSAIALIRERRPHLSMVYLPHLDYDHQRYGPHDERSRAALRQVDGLVARFHELARETDQELVVVSEYGITPVNRPVHPNRILRQAGLITVREELGTERLDAGASDAFAVADHQIAHVYARDAKALDRAREALAAEPGIERILEGDGLRAEGLDHERSGDLVLVAREDAWFTYYYWLDDALAPDYARTVDIHRKPGYDPVELFFDPDLRHPKLKVARRVLGKKLGFRNLLDVIGLDPSLVGGSHGRRATRPDDGPILLTARPHKEIAGDDPFPIAQLPDFLAGLAPTPPEA